MKKICMVLDREFPPDLRVENEIETLTSAGYEIHMLCYTRSGKDLQEIKNGLVIHRKPITDFIYKTSVGAITFPFYFNFWREFLNEACRVNSFEAVHIHDLPLLKVGIGIKNKFQIPVISDLHENWPAYLRISAHTKLIIGRILSPDRKWIEYEKKNLLLSDQVIVVVDEAKDRLIKLGLEPDRINVVSNTLNIKSFNLSEASVKNDNVILFYAGGINFHRGLQTVLYALAKIKNKKPGIRFWILGEGSYKSELEKISKKLDIEELVTFMGWQPYSKMVEKLMISDITIIPHLKSDHTDSTIPHKLFQYMYAQKPVIASDCLPIKRIITETNSGYIYPSDDAQALASILVGLDREKHKVKGENGHKSVINKYNWENDSRVLLDVYRKIENKTSNS
jgi:glycosyltransferase involved in cell wall biosynthesis